MFFSHFNITEKYFETDKNLTILIRSNDSPHTFNNIEIL